MEKRRKGRVRGLGGGKQRPASKLAADQRRRIRRRWRRRVVGHRQWQRGSGRPTTRLLRRPAYTYNSERREKREQRIVGIQNTTDRWSCHVLRTERERESEINTVEGMGGGGGGGAAINRLCSHRPAYDRIDCCGRQPLDDDARRVRKKKERNLRRRRRHRQRLRRHITRGEAE